MHLEVERERTTTFRNHVHAHRRRRGDPTAGPGARPCIERLLQRYRVCTDYWSLDTLVCTRVQYDSYDTGLIPDLHETVP